MLKKSQKTLPNNFYLSTVINFKTQHLEEMSTLLVDPVLTEFTFIGIHISVNVCAIFRFKPMHNLSCGISWLLQGCIWNMLVDDSLETSKIITKTRTSKTFKVANNLYFSS